MRVDFGPGFQILSDDERFSPKIQYESQVEGRVWAQREQDPANSGIFLPRQRIFFKGNITRPIEYEFAINRGLGSINVLNAYLNFHFNDNIEFRVGRAFAPFSYDQFAVSNYWLITPERSVFTTNLSPNRQFRAMAWRYLFNAQLDYAAGVFNSSCNSFESLINNLDFVGFVNTRSFQYSETLPVLRFLNIGTSIAFGRQDQSPAPVTFSIARGSLTLPFPATRRLPF